MQKTERLCRDFALQRALHRAQAGILRTGQGDAPRRAGGLQRRQKPRPAGRDLPAQAAERRAVGVEHRGQRFGQQRAEFLPDRLRAGVPGIGIGRGSTTCEIHTRNDLMFPLSAVQLGKTAEFAALFISRAVNAVTIPVETKMPDNMKAELEKYFMRDKQKAAAAEKEQSSDKK